MALDLEVQPEDSELSEDHEFEKQVVHDSLEYWIAHFKNINSSKGVKPCDSIGRRFYTDHVG